MDRKILNIILALSAILIGVYGYAVEAAIHHGDQRARLASSYQQTIQGQLTELQKDLVALEDENKSLKSQAAEAATQANTSVGQLTAAGQTPIIASPGVITVPTTPSTTTTLVPKVEMVAPPTAATTEPPETSPPTTSPPDTTEPPTTSAPPPTTDTTTTTTTVPPDTTTTTTTTTVPDTTTTTTTLGG